ASAGLPTVAPSSTTSVSAPITGFGVRSRRSMRCHPTEALVRAMRFTNSSGDSSLRGVSTTSRRRPGDQKQLEFDAELAQELLPTRALRGEIDRRTLGQHEQFAHSRW